MNKVVNKGENGRRSVSTLHAFSNHHHNDVSYILLQHIHTLQSYYYIHIQCSLHKTHLKFSLTHKPNQALAPFLQFIVGTLMRYIF